MAEISEVLADALLDSLKTVPFLFAAYLLLELIEHRSLSKLSGILLSGKFGIPGGALLGCIPQCGMSVACSHLFAKGTVCAGTLVAVFMSTSDEAIPVLLSNPDKINTILPLLLVKVSVAVIAGYLFDALFKKSFGGEKHDHSGHTHCRDCEEMEHSHHHHCDDGCENNVFVEALKRTVEVFLYILLFNAAFGILLHFIGEDKISSLLGGAYWVQPFIASAVGLIPNCAASVALTELYMSGAISFGATVAGLSTGAGLGYLALFKANKNWRENVSILVFNYVVAAAFGVLIQLVGVAGA